MSVWREITRGIHALVDRRATDREIDDEVAHYVDQATAAHIASGLTPAQARRAAHLEVGDGLNVRERVREYGWENAAEALLTDVGHAVRRLRAAPGFSAVALVTLAIGIGGSTAIFSAVYPILFQSLPYPDADRIRAIWEVHSDGSRGDGTFGMYRALAERTHAFESMAVVRPWQPTLTGAAQPTRLDGQRVSASYFQVLGIEPALGRSFLEEEDRAGASAVVILGDAIWQRRFGGDPSIVGSTIRLDDREHTVVAVMPAGFANVIAPGAEVWTPLQYEMAEGRAWGHHLGTLGRLRAGVARDEAERELNAIGTAAVQEQRPPTYGADIAWIAPTLQEDLTAGVRPALLAIMGAVLLLLAIACVNVTNLLLARSVQRRGEFALRTALGAGRGRIMRQLLTESLVLATAGGALGMMLAALGVRALVALAPPDLPRIDAIAVDARALLFCLGVTTLVGVLFGAFPALHAAGAGATTDIKSGARHTSGRRQQRLRGGMVVAQVALALVLLVGSGLLLRSLQRLFAVPPGFDAKQMLTLQVQMSGARYTEDGATLRMLEDVLDAVRGVPGVETAALTSQLPLSGDLDAWGVHFESSPTQRPDDERSAFRYAVSPAYIAAMGIPLRSGRALATHDHVDSPLAALISESLARRRFPDGDAVGQRLRIGPLDSEPYTVVGVVGDVKQQSLALAQPDAVYTTVSQWRFADRAMAIVVRAHGDPAALAADVRRAVWSVDGDLPVVRMARLDALVAASAAERRFALMIFQAFALAALLLAGAGIYGVMAGRVAERTREISIRTALGATHRDVIAQTMAQGLRLTALGVGIGLAAAAVASQVVAAMLFGVSRLDPVTYTAVAGVLACVSLVASGVPAWRAARIDPAITLRRE